MLHKYFFVSYSFSYCLNRGSEIFVHCWAVKLNKITLLRNILLATLCKPFGLFCFTMYKHAIHTSPHIPSPFALPALSSKSIFPENFSLQSCCKSMFLFPILACLPALRLHYTIAFGRQNFYPVSCFLLQWQVEKKSRDRADNWPALDLRLIVLWQKKISNCKENVLRQWPRQRKSLKNIATEL